MISIYGTPLFRTAAAVASAIALLSCAAYAQQPMSSAAKLQAIQPFLKSWAGP